jgi:hypothetical protein
MYSTDRREWSAIVTYHSLSNCKIWNRQSMHCFNQNVKMASKRKKICSSNPSFFRRTVSLGIHCIRTQSRDTIPLISSQGSMVAGSCNVGRIWIWEVRYFGGEGREGVLLLLNLHQGKASRRLKYYSFLSTSAIQRRIEEHYQTSWYSRAAPITSLMRIQLNRIVSELPLSYTY